MKVWLHDCMLASADGYKYMDRAFRVFLQHWLDHHPAPARATRGYLPKPPSFGQPIPAVCDRCGYFRTGETVLHFGHADEQGCCLSCGLMLDVSGKELERLAAMGGHDGEDQWALADHTSPTGNLVDQHDKWHKWCTRLQALTVDSIKLALVVLLQKRALEAPARSRRVRSFNPLRVFRSSANKVAAIEHFMAPLPPSTAFRALLHKDIELFLDQVLKVEMIAECERQGLPWPPPGVTVMKEVEVWRWTDDVRIELDVEMQHFSGMQKTGKKTKSWVSEKRVQSGNNLPDGYKVFPSIRATGDSLKRLEAMVGVGQKQEKGLAIGSVVELILLVDVADSNAKTAPPKSHTCYAELKVSVGEPSYFWKVRTQPAGMSCCNVQGGDVKLQTEGFQTLTLWDDRFVTVSDDGVVYNYIAGSRRAFRMDTLVEPATGGGPVPEPSGLPAAWAAVRGDDLVIGSHAGFDAQSEIRTLDGDYVIKHHNWEQSYRALNMKATVCHGRKPADVTCSLWSEIHSKWFMILKSRDTTDEIVRFVASDTDFKVIDSWDLPQAGPQDVTTMIFVPGSGDAAVLVFRGEPPNAECSTVWAFTIVGEVLMSGVELEGMIVRGAAVSSVTVAPEANDVGANPLSASDSGLDFLKSPTKMVEIEYDEEAHAEYDHLVEVERDEPVQVLRKQVVQEPDLDMPIGPPPVFAKNVSKARVWRTAAQSNAASSGGGGSNGSGAGSPPSSAETPLGPVAARLLAGVPGTLDDLADIRTVIEYETMLRDQPAGNAGGKAGGVVSAVAAAKPRRSSIAMPAIDPLALQIPDWGLVLFKEAAVNLLLVVQKAAGKRKRKAATTLSGLRKTLWYVRHSCVCTPAKLSFFGKVFQLVRELNMDAGSNSGVANQVAASGVPDPTATISAVELVFALQLATKGTVYKLGLMFCLAMFAAPSSRPAYTFEQFWPIAAFAERLASRKDVLEPYLIKVDGSTARHPNYHKAIPMFFKNAVDGDPLMDLDSFQQELRASGMAQAHVQEVISVASASLLVSDGKLCFFEFLTLLPVIFGVRAKAKRSR